MLEITSFDIDINPRGIDVLQVLESDSRTKLLNYFSIYEVLDGGISQDGSWAEYDLLMDDLQVLQEYADHIEVEIVDEDTHIFYKIVVTPDKIFRYTGDVVYNDLPREI